MSSIILTLTFLAATQAAPDGWTEVRFHRVYLRNGNFIDGTLISNKPEEVVLLMKWGEMSIRRDQVDKVELMKVKSREDKALVLATPKGTPPAGVTPPKGTPPPVVDTPEAIRKRVDMIMFKFKNSPAGGEKEIPFQDIAAIGEEGAVYLASRIPAFDPKTQEAIAVALIQLGKIKVSEKVNGVLEKLLTNDVAAVRGIAVTVLGSLSNEEGKMRLLRPALQDADAKVRLMAISALGGVESRDWFEPIVDVCADLDADVRNRALRIAKNLAERHGKVQNLSQALLSNSRHPDVGVRRDSVGMLGVLRDKENWRGLVLVLNDQEAAVRAAAAQALMTLGSTEANEEIASALNREMDHNTQIFLIGAVQKLRIQKAIEPLIRFLGEPDEEVKKLAHSTLRTLTGQALGPDKTAWSEWWNSKKPQ